MGLSVGAHLLNSTETGVVYQGLNAFRAVATWQEALLGVHKEEALPSWSDIPELAGC